VALQHQELLGVLGDGGEDMLPGSVSGQVTCGIRRQIVLRSSAHTKHLLSIAESVEELTSLRLMVLTAGSQVTAVYMAEGA